MNIRRLLSLGTMASTLLIASCARTDVGITTTIKAKLAVDDVVKDAKIDVTTNDGVVTLTGNIGSAEAKERALSLAKETRGVVNVRDMIEVQTASGSGDAPDPDRTVGAVIDDAGTTLRVKGRLLEDPVVKGLEIDVDTRDGVVFLTGSVGSEQEKEQAIKLARETAGVKDVQANLKVGNG